MAGGFAYQICEISWTTRKISDQIVLYFQYAYYLTDRYVTATLPHGNANDTWSYMFIHVYRSCMSVDQNHHQSITLTCHFSSSVSFSFFFPWTALVSNLYFLSQMLYNRYSGVLLVRLLGVWKEQKDNPGQSIPVSGLAYYISPPLTLADLWKDPFHAVFYLVFILGIFSLRKTTILLFVYLINSTPPTTNSNLTLPLADLTNNTFLQLLG